jgi:type VI secretion system protein ImpJ
MPHKPIWTEGLLISQHHLQRQDEYHDAVVRERIDAALRFRWGIIELEIDERALVSNQFRLRRLAAVWPDGTIVRCGEGTDEPAPEPRPFEEAFASGAKLEIFVALAHENESSGSVESQDNSSDSIKRYVRESENVPDMNIGGSAQEVEWGRPNLRVLFGSERKDGYFTIRVAELVRKANGQPMVRDNYVPPVLHVDAAPFLGAGLQRVVAAISSRQRELALERKQRQTGNIEFHATDARKFWLLHTLNGSIPVLNHLLEVKRAHPEEAYLCLANLVGQLCSFAPDADPMAIPKFNYLELGDVFEALFARVLSLLSGGLEQAYVTLPLEHRPDGMFIGKIPDPKLINQEFFVAVKANQPEPFVRERVPGLLKIAAWNHIYDVVKQARHGVRSEIEWNPSVALPVTPGVCFFRVKREGPFWEEIVKSNTLALYIPNDPDWAGTSLSVYVVNPNLLR